MQQILFLGDSLTAGYGLNQADKQSFPALIAQKIEGAQLPYLVINAGLSGDTSLGGLQRIKLLVNQPIHIFVLALGANDLIKGIATAQTYQNLQTIITLVKTKNPNVKMLLLGMEIPLPITNKIIAFNKIFRQLADENQMYYMPFLLKDVAGVAHLNLSDGFHPSALGYQIIANNVWAILKPLL